MVETSQGAGIWCFMADSHARTAKTALCARAAEPSLVYGERLSVVVYFVFDRDFVEVRARSTGPA